MKAIITKTRAAAATFAGMLGLFGTAGTAHAQFGPLPVFDVGANPQLSAVNGQLGAANSQLISTYVAEYNNVLEAAKRFDQLRDAYALADQTYNAISGFRRSGIDISLSGVANSLLSRSFVSTGPDADCLNTLVWEGNEDAREKIVSNYGYKKLNEVHKECSAQYNAEKSYQDAVMLAMYQGTETDKEWKDNDGKRREELRKAIDLGVGAEDLLKDPAAQQSRLVQIQAQGLQLQMEMHQMLLMQMNMDAAKNNLDASQRAHRKRMFIQ